MDADESPEEDGPLLPFVHPDDRLWRHPSEMRRGPAPVATLGPVAAPATAPRPWAIALVAGLVGALVASGVLVASGDLARRPTTVLAPVTKLATPDTLATAATGTETGWPAVLDAVSASVASVAAETAGGTRRGSAVVFATDASATYLLTDARLVAQSSPVEVTFNGGLPESARVLHVDDTFGVAVLRVAPGDHPGPRLGTVGSLHAADPVLVVGGHPGGGSATVAAAVSSVDCSVVDASTDGMHAGLLSVAATVAPADDGGALVDAAGDVVGVLTGASTSDPNEQGLSFAVPIDDARQVALAVLAGRSVSHPWLGVEATSDLDSATAHGMGLPGGAQVLQLAAGSPAAAAGMRADDVVVAVDGRPVTSSGALMEMVDDATVGQVASLTYRRGEALGTATVRVAEQPADLDADG
ncbi:MAG TPA: S1C family serine protease [Acidimicrobiales bacterium]|nr:S1C family serine protease [Acidimicrobiales bacterium]